MAFILDDILIAAGVNVAKKIFSGGANNAQVSGSNSGNPELDRSIAYIMDTYAPLAKMQEVWGRPHRNMIGFMGEDEHRKVLPLRDISNQMAGIAFAEATSVMSSMGTSRHCIDTRFAEHSMTADDIEDSFTRVLATLDAVAQSQSYSREKYIQDAALAHKMMTTGTRVFADAGTGAINQLGAALTTGQQVNSIANAGRTYSAAATSAIVQEEQAKSSGRDELLGYVASAASGLTGIDFSKYL